MAAKLIETQKIRFMKSIGGCGEPVVMDMSDIVGVVERHGAPVLGVGLDNFGSYHFSHDMLLPDDMGSAEAAQDACS